MPYLNINMTDEATKGMDNLAIATKGGKGTAKRDALRANEIAVQKQWEEEKTFEVDPSDDKDKETFMVTFPYPYSNGHLHIGHAFSLTKAIFRAQYERHQGKQVLFPFAFHCTGMPIQAVGSDSVGSRVLNCIGRSFLIFFIFPFSLCAITTSRLPTN